MFRQKFRTAGYSGSAPDKTTYCKSSYCNRLSRGLLLDQEIAIDVAVLRVRHTVPLILEDKENGLSTRMSRTVAELYDLFNDLGRRINFFDKEIEAVFRQSVTCKHIAKVKCIGPKTATAVVSENSCHFAVWLGLVPRNDLVLSKTGLTHSDLRRWQINYVGCYNIIICRVQVILNTYHI